LIENTIFKTRKNSDNKKTQQACAKPGIPALAVFIMRPQAVSQIGAVEK